MGAVQKIDFAHKSPSPCVGSGWRGGRAQRGSVADDAATSFAGAFSPPAAFTPPHQGAGGKVAERLDALRAQVRVLERGAGAPQRQSLPLGLPALDDRLPGGGLPLACLHEIEGARAEWDDGAASGFCVWLLIRVLAARPGPLLWVTRRGDLYPPGLADLGLDPERVILVQAGNEAELLWALEEGLKCGELAAVVGECEPLERRAGRRLQLAAEAGGVTAFALIRPWQARGRAKAPSAATTRWQVAPAVSKGDRDPAQPMSGGAPEDAPGDAPGGASGACWQLELLRCRGASPAAWYLEEAFAENGRNQKATVKGESDAARGFALAPVLCDRSLGTAPESQAKSQPVRYAEQRLAG